MNTTIMSEWLQAFYQHIGSREVLLTMDNFSAHISDLEMTPPPNIRITFLPTNSTSRLQPLDQGIIQSFKSHYRRQWISFMLQCYENRQNPLELVNLHLAICWILRSWNNFVSGAKIYNCFQKSTLVISPISLPITADAPDISTLYEQVKSTGNIHDSMAISNFFNPVEEQDFIEGPETDPDQVLQDLITDHLGEQEKDDDEPDTQQPEPRIYSI